MEEVRLVETYDPILLIGGGRVEHAVVEDDLVDVVVGAKI